MKNLIALFTILSMSLAAVAQNDTTRYTMVNGYGFTYNRLKAKAALVFPTDTVQNKLPGSVVVLNDTLYVRKANRWEPVTGGGAGIPSGGTTGQILAKDSDTSYDVSWIDNYTTDVREVVKASTSISKGQAVYVSGADGTNVIVSKASNASEMTSSKTLGLLFQDLAINATGFVIIQGRLEGINTSGATAGDPVWLGTNGNLLFGMANKPVAPAHLVYLGVVTRVNANNGEIFVHVQNGFEIEELHDVLITDSVNNQLLAYDSTTRLWKNRTISTVLGYTPANNATTVKYADTASMMNPYPRGTGTTNTITKWIGSRALGNSNITDNGSLISMASRLSVLGQNYTDNVLSVIPYQAPTLGMYVSPYGELLVGKTARVGGSFLQVGAGTVTFDNYAGNGTAAAFFDGAGQFYKFANVLNYVDVGATDKQLFYSPTQADTQSKFIVGWLASQGSYAGQFRGGVYASGISQFTTESSTGTVNFGFATGNSGQIVSNSTAMYVRGVSGLGLSLGSNGNNDRIYIAPSGAVSVATLAGTGTRMVTADATGVLGTSAIPTGTVTSITAGTGLTGGTITSTGTISADTTIVSTRGWRQKGIDSVNANVALKLNISDTSSMLNPFPRGTGAANRMAYWNASRSLTFTDSLRFDPINNRIHLASPSDYPARLTIRTNDAIDGVYVRGGTDASGRAFQVLTDTGGGTPLSWISMQGQGVFNTAGSSAGAIGLRVNYPGGTTFSVNGDESVYIGESGSAPLYMPKSGTTRYIYNPSGALAINSAGGNVGVGNDAPTEKLDITGRVRIRTIDSTASAINVLYADATGVIKKASATAFPGGSGTLNYIPKWTAANTLGNSQIFEEGTNIIIGSAQASGNKLMVDNVSNYRGIAIRTSTANARPTISLINSNTAQYMSYIQDLNGSLKFGYANFDFGGHVEKMSLSTEGRLLLNTTNDAGYQFDVNGTMRNTGAASFATSDGNVTVGSTTPAGKFGVVVNDANGAGIGIRNNNNSAYMTLLQMGGTGFSVPNWANSSVIESVPVSTGGLVLSSFTGSTIFQNNGRLESMRIRQDGEVAINLGTGDFGNYKFQVDGAMYATGQSILAATSGNVGIGTASPSEKLELYQNSGTSLFAKITNTIGQSGLKLQAGESTTNRATRIDFLNGVASTTTPRWILINDYNQDGTNEFRFASASTASALVLTQAGNVGIGTASPSHRLHVQGAAGENATIAGIYSGTNTSRGLTIGLAADGVVNDAYVVYNSTLSGYGGHLWRTAGTERMRIFNNGRVFIGASPTDGGYQLDVNGNTRVTGKIDVTANESIGHNIVRAGTSDIAAQIYSSNAWLLYGAESSTGGSILTGSTQYAAVVGSGYNRPLQFGTNSTVRMEIDSTGLVGINTTAPTERLDVNGKARIRTVDSTATAMNMLYVDATGVVKKTSVPGTTVAVYNDVASIATGSGFTFAKQYTNGAVIDNVVRVEDVNTTIATVTLQIAAYKTTSTFTTGTWQSFATIPAAYAPTTTVYVPIIDYADASVFTSTGGTQFSNVIEYSGKKVMRIDPSGNVDVRIGTVDNSATLSGTNYVLIPVTATWVINNTVF